MTKRIVLALALVALMPVASRAQQTCKTAVDLCALPAKVSRGPCACFTTIGPLHGVVVPAVRITTRSPQIAQYCCTEFGKIGPLNIGAGAGGICSVILPNGIPARGHAC